MDKAKLEAVWGTMKVADIAAMNSTTEQAVYYWARKHGLPSRLSLASSYDGPVDDDPTPDQIAERAAVVRSKWTDKERQRRDVRDRETGRAGLRVYDSAQLFGAPEAAAYGRI